MIEVHANGWSGDGRTLCGIALEGECARGEGGLPAPIIAKESDEITCEDCRETIRYCQSGFTKNFRVR